MINTHELNLSATEFEQLKRNNYVIVQVNDLENMDYILFRQTEEDVFVMTQVKEIVQHEGMKDGYALLILTKLS